MSVSTMATSEILPDDLPEVDNQRSLDAVLEEMADTILAALPRSDQRRTGIEYIRGLLHAPGRKSIRNIAASAGEQTNEQRLHHFICDSTWDWRQVRQALGNYVTAGLAPRAWVVRPMVIPKAGGSSVGVDRRFFPAFGQVLNGQEAFGVWAALDDRSIPVGWRLHLPSSWLDDPRQRQRAGIPDSTPAESLTECAMRAAQDLLGRGDLPVRPVVIDGRGTDALATVRRFRAANIPVLIRISGTCPLGVTPGAMPGHSHAVPADNVLAALRTAGCAVFYRDHTPAAKVRTSTVVTMRCGFPGTAGRPDGPDDLLFVGIRPHDRGAASELWLTTMIDAQPAELLRLTRLPERVERDFDEIGDQVGLRDFTGRCFGGWHRHMTLASAAHAVRILTKPAEPWMTLGAAPAHYAMCG